ncbi:DEAD/DEAH box helicase, partial [uncultured Prevotella sp.]|uniref:DEAD/DEAH box helicase n=1 Tax=uncultured Prevotella sp. TaxID=159272 RepID=UPI0035B42046
MLRQIEEAFRKHQSVMVQMPTGTGKTILLAEVVKSEKGKVKNPEEVKSEERRAKEVKSEERRVKNPCVWIVVHRRELVEQIEKTLAKQLDSSLFVLHSSLTSLRSSLNPLDSSLFTLRSSLTTRVFSIQWLSKHYHELEEKPSLIIIDEAHHAVAKTYKEVMDAYPEARKLGLTATPCRLNRRGFTDLFDVLLQSWSVKKFIADGWLSMYDYMSIREDSEDWCIVKSLRKRGADGDFSLREMSEKLNVQPSIERLCDTILRYAPDKKGITYAIDIAHAERIAQYYREHGLNAVAISSKTPPEERKQLIEWFRNTNCHELERDSNTNCHELPTNLSTNCHELERDLNTNCHELSSNCRQFKTQNSKIQNRLCRQFKT